MTHEHFKEIYRDIVRTLGLRAEDVVRLEKELAAANRDRQFWKQDVERLQTAIAAAIRALEARCPSPTVVINDLRETVAEVWQGDAWDE